MINDEVVVSNQENLSCPSHEEADTKIIFHVYNVDCNVFSNVTIRCSDTDILIILLGNMNFINQNLKISMRIGTGNNQRFIDVNKLYEHLGPELCSALPAFHALTGCDFNPSFFKKGKLKPFSILKNSKKYTKAFSDLGESNCNTNELFEIIEEYVCRLYGYKTLNNVNVTRVATFMTS